MKKVLSVLLAGAMMLGMSVSAFAANEATYGNGAAAPKDLEEMGVTFGELYVERETETGKAIAFKADKTSDKGLESGDTLYFALFDKDGNITYDIPSNWKVKVSNSAAVDGASYYKATATDSLSTYLGWSIAGVRFLKVQLANDFTADDLAKVRFSFYMIDTKTDKTTTKEIVEFKVNKAAPTTYTKEYIDIDDLDWVLSVNSATEYKYSKNSKSAVATLDFENGMVLADMKFYPAESYKVVAEEKYNKELSKEYDTEVSVIKVTGIENATVVFPAAKDNKVLVEVVDGELALVEATYVENYKFNDGSKATGYLVEDAEFTTYALIDANAVIVEEEAPVEETPVEAEKANPETGAADFVGAAVAMAVVSVAAAGALALKK